MPFVNGKERSAYNFNFVKRQTTWTFFTSWCFIFLLNTRDPSIIRWSSNSFRHFNPRFSSITQARNQQSLIYTNWKNIEGIHSIEAESDSFAKQFVTLPKVIYGSRIPHKYLTCKSIDAVELIETGGKCTTEHTYCCHCGPNHGHWPTAIAFYQTTAKSPCKHWK